ncbi:MAG: hypothetical protein GQ569_10020 [Methylococcaceae bacterium]|nr:hypothetical protein [Methylococcaceae bacterium]
MSKPKLATLELIKESKIYKLLKECDADSRLEASGVYTKGDYSYVVFDNKPDIAKLNNNLLADENNQLVLKGDGQDFEDIAFDSEQQRLLIVQESHQNEQGEFCPRIDEYDLDLNFIESNPVDFLFDGDTNKGIEGLSYVNWGGKAYTLGLSEGNKAKDGKKSTKKGHGRIHVFEKEVTQWGHRATLKLPKSVRFSDYAGIGIEGLRVAVVSQESSALWIGELQEGGWYFVDDGVSYSFPRDDKGEIIYGNVEGVSWLDEETVIVVSDKRKAKIQAKICETKDQSIHIFKVPKPYIF